MRLLPFFFVYLFVLQSSAQSFEVFVDGKSVKVNEQNDVPLSSGLSTYKYVRIPYSGKPIFIEVEPSDFSFNDSDWSISPKRYKINGKKFGNKLSFRINRLGYVVLRFMKNHDFTKRIVLLFEAPEIVPDNRIDIVQAYGVDNSGKKNETMKIQAALDGISGSEKVLYFPPGIYKTYKLEFRSNSRIYLAKRARILADPSSLSSYMSDDKTGLNRFLLIKDVQNLEISGLGTFDGNGTQILGVSHREFSKAINNGDFQGIRLLLIYRSKNIKINGILLKDSARWNTHILESNNVSFSYCKVMNNPNENKYLGSLDGWDPDSSTDVLIENCFGWAGDDTIAIKCTGYGGSQDKIPNSDRIIIRKNVLLTKKSALKIGTETFCILMQNIVFEDNDIIESDRVMGINVRDGALVKEVLFKNNYAEFCYPDRKQMGVNFFITKRNKDTSPLGKIQNITIQDCTFETPFPKKLSFYRYYPETEIKDLSIHFVNLVIGGKKIEEIDPEFFDLKKNNADLIFN